MNKKLILGLLSMSIFSIASSNLILQSEASNISKTQEDLSPLITYTTKKIGDREKMKVTVTVEDRSGNGIKEFRDYNNKLINGNSYAFEITKRGNYVFTAIDNNNNKSTIQVDDLWINPLMEGNNGLKLNGSVYWTSSNIREWLNSDKVNVSYTCNPPSNEYMDNDGYEDEYGFLYQFTEEEKNAIAVTERRVHLNKYNYNKSIDGGTEVLPIPNQYGVTYLSHYPSYVTNYKDFTYKIELDKVFFLNTAEMYWYLNRRDFSYYKPYSESVKKKYNLNQDTRNWWIQGSANWRDVEWIYGAISSNKNLINGTSQYPYYKLGVVPSLNLKPTYILDDGRKASELRIGDIVEFGTYLNSKIQWQVINISDNNYPLLLSTNILELRKYDAKGDSARMYSDYIYYDSYDTSMLNDVEYKSISGSPDIDIPVIRVLDDTPLSVRQNGDFSLEFEVEDIGESGIKYIELPNGNKITNLNFTYTFNENKNYIFKMMDNAGNFTDFAVPVSNINQEPIVTITSSATDWSKEDVQVDIRTSNNVVQEIKTKLVAGTEYSGSVFPNYTNYTGKNFRVYGTLEVLNYDEKALNSSIDFGFFYKKRSLNEFTYAIQGVWHTGNNILIRDIINDDGMLNIDFELTIPSNYASGLQPWIRVNLSKTSNSNLEINTDIKYELIDDSDFKINSIVLPDGGKILYDGAIFTDIISKEGILINKYTVVDNRYKETSKTITTKIDKTAPTLNLNYDTNTTNQNISVNINASDATSGVKRIKLPNGNYITNLNSTYTISGDGKYTFECEDVAGNITTKIININNIDKEKPSITIDKDNTEWTNKGVQININARD